MTEDVEKPQSQLLEEIGLNEAVETVEALASVQSPPLRDHEQQREKIASWIAMGLFSLFAFTVIAPLICFMWGGCLDPKVIAYVEAMAAHEIVLLGIIIAFYFSERRQKA